MIDFCALLTFQIRPSKNILLIAVYIFFETLSTKLHPYLNGYKSILNKLAGTKTYINCY